MTGQTESRRGRRTTIRLKLLEIGAQVRVTVREIWVSLRSAYPHANVHLPPHAPARVASPCAP